MNLEYIITRAGQITLVPMLFFILLEIIKIRKLMEKET